MKSSMFQELGNLCRLLDSNPALLVRHRAQLHTMLGLYAMSMNCMEAAESQLNAALRVSQRVASLVDEENAMDRVRLTELFLYPPFSPFIIKEVGLNKSS